ncbi:MAG: DUF4912 domain-containing protein [Endomicrobiia bacterium]|nr:DUF4912 domain-containing protein [Endomicrobiia bacterium]
MVKNPGSLTLTKTQTARTSIPRADKGGLPGGYGDTKIVALPRDPLWIYAYWEINPKDMSATMKKLPPKSRDGAAWILRVHDITGVKFTGSNSVTSFDIFVAPESGSWHINCGRVNRVWCVDIGLSGPDGIFVLAARSNAVPTPRFGISPIVDDKWGIVEKDFYRIMKLSGADDIGAGSFSTARLMLERWKELMSLPSSGTKAGSGK